MRRTTSGLAGSLFLRQGAIFCALSVLLWAPLMSYAQALYPFDLPAQPLAESLRAIGHLSSTNVMFEPRLVKGLAAPAIRTQTTAAEAIRLVLVGTQLTALQTAADTILIRRVVNEDKPTPDGQTAVPRFKDDERYRVAQAEGVSTGAALDESKETESTSQVKSVQLEEIVVTAQKRQERIQDVPISVAVVRGADLDRSTVQGISEALSAVPGVAVNEGWQGGGTQITVRGVTSSGPLVSGSNVVGYYLDSAPFGLVRSAVAPDSNAFDLAQVEVLRGPQGTLYGASALNGVVRILTNDADLENFAVKARGYASTTDGGGGNYRGDLAVNAPIVAGALALRAVVGYDDLSGWINSATDKHVNNANERNYRVKLNAAPNDDLSIVLSAWRSNDDYGAPSIADRNGFNAAINAQPLTTTYDTYSVKVAYRAPGFNLSSMTSYLDYMNTGDVDLVPFSGGDDVLNTTVRSRVYSEEVLLTSTGGGPWKWTAGAIYRNGRDRTYQPFRLVDLAATVLLADFFDTSKSYAIYGEIGRKFLEDRLEWTLGGRYFHDDVGTQANGQLPGQPFITQVPTTASFSHTSPRAVLSWFPSQDVTAYVCFSQGFRSGIAQDELVTLVAPDFAPVKPDTLNNYEIGMKQTLLDRRLALDVSVYYIDWRDVQQVINVPLGGGLVAPATVNGSGAGGVGFDLGIFAAPLDNLTLGASFNLNDLTQKKDVFSDGVLLFAKGERLNYSPQYTMGVSGEYWHPLGTSGFHGHLSAAAAYTAKQDATALSGAERLIAAGDAILNGRVGLSLTSPGDHWSAKLYADNLTNDRGTPLAYPLIPAGYWNTRIRPRTCGLQLEYRLR